MRERYTAVCIGGPKDGAVLSSPALSFVITRLGGGGGAKYSWHEYALNNTIANFWIHDSLDPDAPSTCERVRKAWLRGTPEGRTC